MALARFHGGPLDWQILPLDDIAQETRIVPYSEPQIIYRRNGVLTHTGADDGPTEVTFRFVESEDGISSSDD